MYLPKVFAVEDKSKITKFIKENSFADLVTCHKGVLSSNKIPFYFDENENTLYGHFAKNNPQLIDIEVAEEVLVILSGAQTYISPNYYASQDTVPTWNFQTLQIRGTASLLDSDGLIKTLKNLTRFHEKDCDTPWTMSHLGEEKLKKMLGMIVGFKVKITEIKFKEKMSQNRSVEEQRSVINSLEQIDNNVSKIMSDNLIG